MTREQHNFRLHPQVSKFIKMRAKQLGVSECCVIEMMAKEADGGSYISPEFQPGIPIRHKESKK